MIMAVPKFRAGERASITASRMPSSAGGNYNIIRVLPASRGEPIRYQVKGDSERFERIVDEGKLISLIQAARG